MRKKTLTELLRNYFLTCFHFFKINVQDQELSIYRLNDIMFVYFSGRK